MGTESTTAGAARGARRSGKCSIRNRCGSTGPLVQALEARCLMATVTVNGFDRQAILNAINASSPGDTIFFPAGIYNTSQEIFVKGGGRTYLGDGGATLIGTGTHIFHLVEDGATFKFLNFQGEGIFIDRTNSSQSGNVRNVVIDNNHFNVVGGDNNGIYFTQGIRDSFITNNTFDAVNADQGIYGFGWNNLVIANNAFLGGTGEAIHVIDNSDTGRDLLIEQNYFSGLHRMGIEYQGGGWNTIVQDNYYENPLLYSNVNLNLGTFAYSIVADRSHNTITRRNTAIAPQRPDGTGVREMFELGGSNLDCYQNYSVGGYVVIAANGSHATGVAHDNRISNYLVGPYNANSATVQFANNGPNVGLTWDINRGKPGPNHRIDGTDIPTPPGDDDPDPPPPPPPDPNLPGTPGHLSGYTSGTSTINLTWSDNANNETGYQVELLSADGVTWLVVGTLGADVKTFQMTQLTSGQPYTFRVRAFNGFGFSDPSNQALIKMPLPDNSTTQAPNTNTTRQTRPALSQRTGTTSILPTVVSDV